MVQPVHRYETSTSIVKSVPAEIDAGSNLALQFRVTCAPANLESGTLQIVDQAGHTIDEIELAPSKEGGLETPEFELKAPTAPGDYTWSALCAARETSSAHYAQSSAAFSFAVKPHSSSMAVWNVPTFQTEGTAFAICVGVQCTSKCRFAGQTVEVYDQALTRLAVGILNADPLPSTDALFWAEIPLTAPNHAGLYNWTVRFSKPEMDLAHAPTDYPFAFNVVKSPEHTVTVEVVDKSDQTPVAGAQIIMHPYRAETDDRGIGQVPAAKGEYTLLIASDGIRKSYVLPVQLNGDLHVRAELERIPQDPS